MKKFLTTIVLAVILILTAGYFFKAKAADISPTQKCELKEYAKTIGVGAAYGAGVALVAYGFPTMIASAVGASGSVAAAPAGAAIAILKPATFVAVQTINGGLLGAGATIAGMLYTESKTGALYTTYCTQEYVKGFGNKAEEAWKGFKNWF